MKFVLAIVLALTAAGALAEPTATSTPLWVEVTTSTRGVALWESNRTLRITGIKASGTFSRGHTNRPHSPASIDSITINHSLDEIGWCSGTEVEIPHNRYFGVSIAPHEVAVMHDLVRSAWEHRIPVKLSVLVLVGRSNQCVLESVQLTKPPSKD